MNWLDTVRTLTDMRVARDTIADVQYAVDVLEGLDFEPGCESPNHEANAYGHKAEQDAKWIVQSPCGQSRLACDSWVQATLEFEAASCFGADHHHNVHEYRFIPLTPRSTP